MKKVVSATLAGALAVGMVPAMALADDTAIELQATDVDNLIIDGSFYAATDEDGAKIVNLKKIELKADGDARYVIPTKFKTSKGDVIDITKADFDIEYYKGASLLTEMPVLPGDDYKVVIKGNGNGDYTAAATLELPFKILSADMAGAYVYEGTDLTDTKLVYTGLPLTLGVAHNGKAVPNGGITYIDSKGVSGSTAPTAPGKYTARFTVNDATSIYDGDSVDVAFTVAKYNAAADAALGFDDVNTLAADPAVTDLGMTSDLAANFDLVQKSIPTAIGDLGTYTYTLQPKDEDAVTAGIQNANVEGVKDFSFAVYAEAAKFNYAGSTMPTSVTIDLSNPADKAKLFDSNMLLVSEDGTKDTALKYDIFVYDNLNDKAANVADLSKPGNWTVTIKADAKAANYAFGGSVEIDYAITGGEIDTAKDVFVMYDGKVVDGSGFEVVYNGEDVVSKLTYMLRTANGDVVLGSDDYEVEITSGGNPVAKAVDAGTYTITLTSEKYTSSGSALSDTVNFEIKKVDLLNLRIANVIDADKDGTADEISYTGAAIEPVIEWQSKGADTTTDTTDDVWSVVDPSLYTLTYAFTKTANSPKDAVNGAAKAMKEMGSYVITLNLTTAAQKNYIIDSANTEMGFDAVEVTDYRAFKDVANGAWYYDEVLEAATYVVDSNGLPVIDDCGYLFGYGDPQTATVFGPEDDMTREQMAMVLARMAKQSFAFKTDGSLTNTGFQTPFGDVNANAWYAQAVKYVNDAKLMTGYTDGSGNFGVGEAMTREEMAVALYRYANQMNLKTKAAAGTELAGYADGDEVSPFAKEAMAWAVANEVFGVDTTVLNPQGEISRAQTAAVTVRLQPVA